MGETQHHPQPDFNSSFQISPRPLRLTHNAGAPLIRDLLDRTKLIEFLVAQIKDPRSPRFITYSLGVLLRSWVRIDHGAAEAKQIGE